MQLVEPGIPALVYKSDAAKDLALLKLASLPKDEKQLPVLKLAPKSPATGEDCLAVGHPRAGVLWTLRGGKISGTGKFPADLIQIVMARLSASNDDRATFERELASLPQRAVILSDCGLNPGDSGGPLLNEQGEVIAVSYGGPPDDADDKISYHVHLDELKKFLADAKPLLSDSTARPPIHLPDAWPKAAYHSVEDIDGDGTSDALLFSTLPPDDPRGKLTGFLLDLDQNSKPGKANRFDRTKWDIEFAFHFDPYPRAFYDTNNDGQMDLIVSDADDDGKADVVLQLTKKTGRASTHAGLRCWIHPDSSPLRWKVACGRF